MSLQLANAGEGGVDGDYMSYGFLFVSCAVYFKIAGLVIKIVFLKSFNL